MIWKRHFSTPTLNKGWGGDKEGRGHGVAAFGSPGPVVIRNGVSGPCLPITTYRRSMAGQSASNPFHNPTDSHGLQPTYLSFTTKHTYRKEPWCVL